MLLRGHLYGFSVKTRFFEGLLWADPGVLWKKAPRAIRAMRGKTLRTVPFKGISTVLWVHQKLPQSTVSQAFPSNKSYESKTGCNRTPATVLWVPLILEGSVLQKALTKSIGGRNTRFGRVRPPSRAPCSCRNTRAI